MKSRHRLIYVMGGIGAALILGWLAWPDRGGRAPATSPAIAPRAPHPVPSPSPAPDAGVEPDAALPEMLTREDIQSGVDTVGARVARCNEPRTSAKIDVIFAIDAEGRVTRARTFGAFADTALGACVEKAVLEARFRRWAGPSLTIKYPFQLQ